MRFLTAVVLTALLGVVYWVGATAFTEKIENDITERSSAAISEVNPNVDLDVDGRDVTLTGLVNTDQDRDVAKDTVDSVWGVRASKSLLEVRDGYDFNATHYDTEGLTIDGVVDSPEAVAHMRDAIAPVVPKGSVDTNARPLTASPEKLALGAGALLMLTEGELEIDEEQFVIRGTAADDQIKQAIEDNLNSRRAEIDPLALITEIAIADATTQACRDLQQAVINNNKVLFAVDRAVVSDEFSEVIALHSQLLAECQGVLMVEAHADQDGSEDYNLQLSQRRAQAVMDAIASTGISSERLQLYSYGEMRPVASNETTNDKTYNRRVELQYVHQAHSALTTLHQPIISSQNAE